MVGKLCGELKLLQEGRDGIVVAEPTLWAELERVRTEVQASAGSLGRGRQMDRYASGVTRVRSYMAAAVSSGFVLVGKQGWLVTEGKHKSGQPGMPDVAVFAFKHDQYRCYGGFLQYGSRKCFVCIEADEAKKQNKADAALLKRVAKGLAEFAAEAVATPLKPGEEWPIKVAATAAPRKGR
jgi:hypothetical protein